MKVLVTAASRHGSTAEIATIIAGIIWTREIARYLHQGSVVAREPHPSDARG